MKFDRIIMNPPYSGSLHLKILSEAMKHSDEIVNLSPIRWLQDPLAEYKKGSDYSTFKDVLNAINDIEEIKAQDANKLFNTQMGDLGIYHLLSSNAKGYVKKPDTIINKVYNYKDKVITHITTNKESSNFCQVLEFYGGKPLSGSGWVKHPDYSSRSSSTATEESTIVKGCSFATRNEAINFYNSFKTKFYIYLWIKLASNGRFFCGRYFPYLDDYTHPWTDEMLYKYFNLTPEEIEVIENEV